MTFDDRLGKVLTILLGTWVCSMLYAEVLRYTWFYFKKFPRDSLLLKALVAATVLSDSASLAADYADVYLNSVTHWGDQTFILNQYWPVTLYLSTTGITAALVQSFLTVRYYNLTHNRIFALVTFAFIGCALATCEATAITLAMHPAYNDRFKSRTFVIVWSATTAVADIIISGALILQLSSIKSSVNPDTESAIKRLIRQTIQTGTASSAIAVCILVSFVIDNASNIESMFVFILGRIYVLTLLLNLNMRKSKQVNTSGSDNKRHTRGNPPIPLDRIQVHRTIHIEDDLEFVKSKPTYNTSVIPVNPQSQSNSNGNHDLEFVPKGQYGLNDI